MEVKKFVAATRRQQKTIYEFIKQYSFYMSEKESSTNIKDYYLYKSKSFLKKVYIEVVKSDVVDDPLQHMRDDIENKIFNFTEDLIETGESKTESLIDGIEVSLRNFIEDLALKLAPTETFSLALAVMSKERATKFIRFLIDYFLDNEIGLGKKLHKMIIENEHDRFIYAMLRNRKCAVCGKEDADLHHWKSAGSLGGYKSDYGQGLYISLCREHHTEEHNIGHTRFLKKYSKSGISLTDYQVELLKEVYKNHFRGKKK